MKVICINTKARDKNWIDANELVEGNVYTVICTCYNGDAYILAEFKNN